MLHLILLLGASCIVVAELVTLLILQSTNRRETRSTVEVVVANAVVVGAQFSAIILPYIDVIEDMISVMYLSSCEYCSTLRSTLEYPVIGRVSG